MTGESLPSGLLRLRSGGRRRCRGIAQRTSKLETIRLRLKPAKMVRLKQATMPVVDWATILLAIESGRRINSNRPNDSGTGQSMNKFRKVREDFDKELDAAGNEAKGGRLPQRRPDRKRLRRGTSSKIMAGAVRQGGTPSDLKVEVALVL
jgi:hypothetical protein